jgi:hypothetical protein
MGDSAVSRWYSTVECADHGVFGFIFIISSCQSKFAQDVSGFTNAQKCDALLSKCNQSYLSTTITGMIHEEESLIQSILLRDACYLARLCTGFYH